MEIERWGVKRQVKDLIKHVLENDLKEDLDLMVQEAWTSIEASLDMGWGRRYE